jgi:hypothetical protein
VIKKDQTREHMAIKKTLERRKHMDSTHQEGRMHKQEFWWSTIQE